MCDQKLAIACVSFTLIITVEFGLSLANMHYFPYMEFDNEELHSCLKLKESIEKFEPYNNAVFAFTLLIYSFLSFYFFSLLSQKYVLFFKY